MTPAAAVLFVFVTHGAAPGPSGDVVAACLRELPAGTRPITRVLAEAPADGPLLADASAAGASAVVVVSWAAADLREADVRAVVGLPDHPQWVTRAVTFAPGDQLSERARALGLVIASVVQEGLPQPAVPPPASPPPARAAPPVVLESRPVEAAAPAPIGDDGTRWAIEAGVTTALEDGTDGDDVIGGTLGLRRSVTQNLFARAGLAFRLTDRDVPITSRAFSGALGLGWASARFGRPRTFGLGARLDLLVMRETVRVSSDQPLTAHEKAFWAGAVDLLGEVGLGLSRATTFLAGLGVEERFTQVLVVVPGQNDTTLPRERLVLELGILSRF